MAPPPPPLLPLAHLLLVAAVGEAAAGVDLGALTRQRVQQVLDRPRAEVLNASLGDGTTAAQALAINNLLGVCGIPGWPTGNGDMGAWDGMCRVKAERPWRWPFDHGLHCNMVNEWYFFVGTFHLHDVVIGVEFMLSFQKLAPDGHCTCEYDANSTLPPLGTRPRLSDPSGRLAEAQLSVIVAPTQRNGSAVSSEARHYQAAPLVEWWTGEGDRSIAGGAGGLGQGREWGFRVGGYKISARTDALDEMSISGSDRDSGLSVDLHLRRALPPLMQGHGSGYVGDPPNANGEAYYSLPGLAPTGNITAAGVTYQVRPEHGLGWVDHQFGSIGVSSDPAIAALAYGRYAVADQNVNPVNLGFGVPGTEIWFGVHIWDWRASFDDAEQVGQAQTFIGAFTAHFVDGMHMWSEHPENWKPGRGNSTLPFASLMLADGSQYKVEYAYQVLEWFTADDGSRYGTKFLLLRQGHPSRVQRHWEEEEDRTRASSTSQSTAAVAVALPEAFYLTSVAADSRTEWASGGNYYEGVVEATDFKTGRRIGYGYTEGVGWDRGQIKETVRRALRLTHGEQATDEVVALLSSRPPHSRPPPR